MKHHKFTEAEREELLSCPHISKVKGSNIEYTSSFKAYALTAKTRGMANVQIFIKAGIPRWLITRRAADSSLSRWAAQAKSTKEVKVGRPRLKSEKPIDEMTQEELKAKVRYLEAVVEFQKQIRAL